MAVTRFYSSVAPLMTLQSALSASATAVLVDTTAGLPASTPFTICIDEDQVNQELCDVTNVAGSTLTVVRGVDGTVGIAHDPGALITHDHSARDDRDSREHEAASSGVHGVAGDLVGTTDTQALTNKVIDGASNTLTNIPASTALTGLVPKANLPTDTVYLATAQTLTNKTITAPLGIVKADVGLGNVDNTSNATERAAVATLANKSISGSANTLTNIPNSAITSIDGAAKITGVIPSANLPANTVYGTWVTVSGASAVDAQTNYLDQTTVVKYNTGMRLVQINAKFALSAGTNTANANGGLTDVPTVKLVSGLAAILPTDKIYGVGEYNGVELGVYLDTAGNVTLFQGSPNLVITNGTTMTASLFYTY